MHSPKLDRMDRRDIEEAKLGVREAERGYGKRRTYLQDMPPLLGGLWKRGFANCLHQGRALEDCATRRDGGEKNASRQRAFASHEGAFASRKRALMPLAGRACCFSGGESLK